MRTVHQWSQQFPPRYSHKMCGLHMFGFMRLGPDLDFFAVLIMLEEFMHRRLEEQDHRRIGRRYKTSDTRISRKLPNDFFSSNKRVESYSSLSHQRKENSLPQVYFEERVKEVMSSNTRNQNLLVTFRPSSQEKWRLPNINQVAKKPDLERIKRVSRTRKQLHSLKLNYDFENKAP